MGRKHVDLYARIVANTAEPESSTGCWVWTARHDGKRGGEYGRLNLWIDGRRVTRQAHRVMAELVAGRPLHPDNDTVEHLCGVTLCCNPDHMVLLPRSENSGRKRPSVWLGL